jgi:hypothetical protein
MTVLQDVQDVEISIDQLVQLHTLPMRFEEDLQEFEGNLFVVHVFEMAQGVYIDNGF